MVRESTRRPADGGRLRITVLLEDPRLPYPYQAGGAFNDVDRADRKRLRLSLQQLSQYRFEFLDHHDDLAAALTARRPRFVFNLCDTGFRNDARRSVIWHVVTPDSSLPKPLLDLLCSRLKISMPTRAELAVAHA